MDKGKTEMNGNVQPFVEAGKILEVVTGSHAYGFATADSDMDVRGITVPSLDYILGCKHFEQQEYSGQDKVIYGLKKFVELALDCNPNIIELLYIPDRHVLFADEWGRLLRDNSGLFLSKKARHTFAGYAFAQLKRIKRHKRWLDNPPEKPNPMDFQFTRYMVLKEKDGHYMPTKVDKWLWDKTPENLRWTESGIMSEYDAKLKDYQQYCTWRKERNPDRAVLEEKFGFDTKHASHLVRLFRMGEEIFRDGKVIVDRNDAGDAQEIFAIRQGSMKYDDIIEYAEKAEERLDVLYATSNVIQNKPNVNGAWELYKKIVCGKLGLTFVVQEVPACL